MSNTVMNGPCTSDEWMPIQSAPFGDEVWAKNDGFGPYKYTVGEVVFADPPPTLWMPIKEASGGAHE